MLFNSIPFLLFFPTVFMVYWFVVNKNLRAQNLLLLLASYIFYGWWDWRFLSLILMSTLVDFIAGKRIYSAISVGYKKRWLAFSILFNLGLLGFFKYYNFFVDSWIDAFSTIGYSLNPWTLRVILPVGISFYTFQTMSYSIDIYRGKIKPTGNFIGFAAFVAFFPQLVAGPIERASNLLPQLLKTRIFKYRNGVAGLRLILWGMFKKVVIADSLAGTVEAIFSNYTSYSGFALILGVLFFAIQIYCDFSGYSDIAIGLAKLLGIDLMVNFKFPYFSQSIAEFWRKWHISLSSWFRDYLYIPLGGSRVSMSRAILNVFIVFLVSGFWHGANWTFIAWGGIHALFFVPSFVIEKSKLKSIVILNNKLYTKVVVIPKAVWTFVLVCFAWIFFRAENLTQAIDFISYLSLDYQFEFIKVIKYIIIFLLFEIVVFNFRLFEKASWFFKFGRYLFYTYVLMTIIAHTTNTGSDFIYFQF